jgi:Tfp pilus assembly protein PilX
MLARRLKEILRVAEAPERGCLSRSTFDNPETMGFRASVRQAKPLRVGGTVTRHRGQCRTNTSRTHSANKGRNALSRRTMQTSTQAPKGKEYGVCVEVCIGSNARQSSAQPCND